MCNSSSVKPLSVANSDVPGTDENSAAYVQAPLKAVFASTIETLIELPKWPGYFAQNTFEPEPDEWFCS